MSQWVNVAAADGFLPGSVRRVDLDDGRPVAVFNVDGRFYAIEDQCTHAAETLSDGEVEADEIVCPRHGARFSLVTGAALCAPAYEPVATYPVRIAGGVVQIDAGGGD